ncbi:cytoskeletal protein RodZ [Psychromicrobium silvestre]|uniref:Cytoskeletal protein RodZ n=1 Tax=Psychromicrobium silvestre TaxID=1645614 RepID=A0A7Y9LV93_9MICC|nr:excalibur calcium-binding domain-containing protein [Psychromicrobium silvestre]NYE96206.1 cytoskeletal protein RodZ [Psychromicrobium silvestre]
MTIIIALVVLIFGRGNWAWMKSRGRAGAVLGAAFATLVVGAVLIGLSAPPKITPVDAASTPTASSSDSASTEKPSVIAPSATPKPSPTATLKPVVPAPTTVAVKSPEATVPTPAAAAPKPTVPAPVPLVKPAPAPKPVPVPAPVTAPAPSTVYYKNCDAVRQAGAAPLYANQPGYRSGLDGDHDGIACEPKK